MAFREFRVFEVREILRLWLLGNGYRRIAELVDADRKTIRRYVEAAVEAGLDRDSGDAVVGDELIGMVIGRVRPGREGGYGDGWRLLVDNHEQIERWLADGLTVVKVGELLARRGIVVAERTLHRYASEVCDVGRGRRGSTVRVADGDPGGECQVDFGKMGLLWDPVEERRRVAQALIFTAALSRHCFVWVCWRQTLDDVICGFEAAWVFFGGIFATVIPDNLKAIVEVADDPDVRRRLNRGFVEYAQDRGFVVDPARIRRPQDKPRVERTVQYVRNSMWAGEKFVDLEHCRRHSERWCREVAGMRIHRTIQARPAEVFELVELPAMAPPPTGRYDVPIYRRAKVHRDHHIEVAKALYSVPGDLIGGYVDVRADSKLVRISSGGNVVKVHPRQPPGSRSTDPDDYPSERTAYAMRDLDKLRRHAEVHGGSVAVYVDAVLDHPTPWTKMRQVYRLLGYAKKWGSERLDAACARALDAEAVDVGLIGRMLERATENNPASDDAASTTPTNVVVAGRFARDQSEFETDRGGVA